MWHYCFRILISPWNVFLLVLLFCHGMLWLLVIQNHCMTSFRYIIERSCDSVLASQLSLGPKCWEHWTKSKTAKMFCLTFAFSVSILKSLCNQLETFIYFIPLRSIWFAAMSITLMMNAMAKAQIRLLRTHVCFSCWVGLAVERFTKHISISECLKRPLKMSEQCVK